MVRALGALALGAALAACADDGVRNVEGFDTHEMEAMTPPIRSPRTLGGHDHTVVWLSVPAGARATAVWLAEQGRHALRFPPGTTAARVESWNGVVADVRGTRLEAGDAERFFVFRPGPRGLAGVEWTRGRPEAQSHATARLRALAPDEHTAEHLVSQNDCAACHVHGRARNTRPKEHGFLNRATDANGFFAIEGVLEDEAPLETYRPNDPNVDDPYVEVRCGAEPAERILRPDERRARCRDGSVPRARYDLPRALAAGEAHAREVCASRRALFRWLDDEARRAFATAFAECPIDGS